MKSVKLTGFAVVCSLIVIGFQNCSDVTVGMGFVEAPSKMATPPICRDVASAEVAPVELYKWDKENTVEPLFNNVMSSAVVGDLNKDGIPEILFTTFKGAAYDSEGIIRVLNGQDGKEMYSVTDPELRPFGTISPAIIDIDGDGLVEIFYLGKDRKSLIVLNFDGSKRWIYTLPAAVRVDDSLSATDLNSDGIADIIAPGVVVTEDANKQPKLLMSLEIASPFSFAANVQTFRVMNIVTNSGLLNHQGKVLFRYKRPGAPGIADLYPEVPGAEIIVVGGGYLAIHSAKGEVLYDHNLTEHTELSCSGSVGGGQPTVGDFDGNPQTLEIAVATGRSLTIFDSKGNKIAGSLTTDCSSRKTGVASFDFNGDGKPEIVYADEQHLRIYEMDGSNNLKIIWELLNPSGTLSEYPVVADVDNDGYANIVVVQNAYSYDSVPTSPYHNVKGIKVFGPAKKGAWMPTRSIWNENSYFISNVTDKLRPRSSTMMNGGFATSFKRNTFSDLEKEVRCDEAKDNTQDANNSEVSS